MKTVLGTINDHPIDSIEELLPTNKKLFTPTQS
ncbi:MAG: hypothetical protein MI921_30535 [Cytophagales bacterium]|nr:hypothetical protein [Cytophagales bacterium]